MIKDKFTGPIFGKRCVGYFMRMHVTVLPFVKKGRNNYAEKLVN